MNAEERTEKAIVFLNRLSGYALTEARERIHTDGRYNSEYVYVALSEAKEELEKFARYLHFLGEDTGEVVDQICQIASIRLNFLP